MRTNGRYGNLVAAIATIACCDVALGLTFQLLPQIMEWRGISATVIGLNAAMGPLGILLAGPLLPGIVARTSSKQVAGVAIAVVLVALFAFAYTSSLAFWFVLRFLFGIAVGALFTISETWILTFSEAGNRGRVMGIYTGVLAITFAFGPWIIPFTGIEGPLPWLIGAACVAVSALPLAFVNVSEAAFKHAHQGSFLRVVKRAPALLAVVGAVTLFDSVLLSFFAIFGIRNGLSEQTANWVLAAGIVGNVVLQFPIGYLADRWSRRGVIAISAGLTVALSLALIWAVGNWTIWPVTILVGSTAFAAYTVTLAMIGDVFEGAELVAASAAFGMMWGIGGVAGPPLAGLAVDAFGIDALPVFFAAVFALMLLGLALNRGQLIRGPAGVDSVVGTP